MCRSKHSLSAGAPGLKILPSSIDAKNSEVYSEEAVLSEDNIQDTVFFKTGPRGISSTSAIPAKDNKAKVTAASGNI